MSLNNQADRRLSHRVILLEAERNRLPRPLPEKVAHKIMSAATPIISRTQRGMEVLHIAIQRKALRGFPMPGAVKLLLRACYAYMRWVTLKYGWSASKLAGEDEPNGDFHSLELKGVYIHKADAWHAVNCDAGVVKPVPFNAELPDVTCSFGPEDWPALDGNNRRRYQLRKLPYIAISREQFDAIDERTEQIANHARGLCVKA